MRSSARQEEQRKRSSERSEGEISSDGQHTEGQTARNAPHRGAEGFLHPSILTVAGTSQRRQEQPPARTSTSPAPWASEEIHAISEMVNTHCAGGSGDQFEEDEEGLDIMDVQPVTAPGSALDVSVDLDESRVYDMRDLIPSEIAVHRLSLIHI